MMPSDALPLAVSRAQDGASCIARAPGARLSLREDRNERDFDQPIVSVSLGLPAIFLWGGKPRADRARRIPLIHGDIMVWGGPDRLTFHGVHSLAEGEHPLTGAFRRAL